MDYKNLISNYPDFPKDGILFRDMFPILRSPEAMTQVLNELKNFIDEVKPDCIVGIESRGFIIGTALSVRHRMSFIPIRKKGKLPGISGKDVIGVDYALEYGKDTLEILVDAFDNNPRVLLVDDLLATGGTVEAACRLIGKTGAEIVGCGFIIELDALKGREKINNIPVRSLIRYD